MLGLAQRQMDVTGHAGIFGCDEAQVGREVGVGPGARPVGWRTVHKRSVLIRTVRPAGEHLRSAATS